ncbi:MAG TPA: type II secretion system protein [Phycisphaerae bacterium]|nr:type II secretion system protein [Phycisphaerae bacterium]
MRKARGFSLIEVLVVVSIIALLVGITMPSFKEARRQARKTVCKKNLQTIGLGIHAYLTTNRDTFPWCCRLPSEEAGVAAGENRAPYVPLPVALKNEMKGKSEVFLCPADENTMMMGTVPTKRYYDTENLSYEWESSLNGLRLTFKGVSMLNDLIVARSSEMWMLFDFEAFHGGERMRGSHNALYADLRVQSDNWNPAKVVGQALDGTPKAPWGG